MWIECTNLYAWCGTCSSKWSMMVATTITPNKNNNSINNHKNKNSNENSNSNSKQPQQHHCQKDTKYFPVAQSYAMRMIHEYFSHHIDYMLNALPSIKASQSRKNLKRIFPPDWKAFDLVLIHEHSFGGFSFLFLFFFSASSRSLFRKSQVSCYFSSLQAVALAVLRTGVESYFLFLFLTLSLSL